VETDEPARKWVVAGHSDIQTQLRLFCFPYAGAGASIFREWERELPAAIQLCRVQLPGREERLHERPLAHVTDITSALVYDLQPWLDRPFVFFGHSMGALIAFELARELRRLRAPLPQRLFLSGRPAPHIKSRMSVIHHLPDSEFKRELGRLNGTRTKVLDDTELMTLLMPMLRADFSVCETYVCSPGEPLPIPITVLGAITDAYVWRQDLEGWRAYTSDTMKLLMFPGDHFYLHPMRSQLIAAVICDLAPALFAAPTRLDCRESRAEPDRA